MIFAPSAAKLAPRQSADIVNKRKLGFFLILFLFGLSSLAQGQQSEGRKRFKCDRGRVTSDKFFLRDLEADRALIEVGFLSLEECGIALDSRLKNFICTPGRSIQNQFFIRNIESAEVLVEAGFASIENCATGIQAGRGQGLVCTPGRQTKTKYFPRDLQTGNPVPMIGYDTVQECARAI